MAPSRLAPNAVADALVDLKRWANTRLAVKIGRNASVTAATNRGTNARPSSAPGGTAHARTRPASSRR